MDVQALAYHGDFAASHHACQEAARESCQCRCISCAKRTSTYRHTAADSGCHDTRAACRSSHAARSGSAVTHDYVTGSPSIYYTAPGFNHAPNAVDQAEIDSRAARTT